jgi:FAD/FMN-containing dehydrogenase
MLNIARNKVDQLKNKIMGKIVLPDDPDYDQVRKIWNAMIDRRPAIIVQCSESNDVSRALSFARENRLEFSIRGAGHNIAGNSLCNDGMVIDLSTMKNVRVDAGKKRAYVQPGATLGDFDTAVQAHGLATPIGINSTTGISGLTLGGGFGWLTRIYGMTVDNLVSAEVITADGKKSRASEKENTDLFWAIRGGGGNFGVVTEFEFQLHPFGPQVFAGLIVFPFEQAKSVLTQYRDFITSAPEESNVFVVIRHAPPLPFLPKNVHGKKIVVLALFHPGNQAKGEKLAGELRGFGNAYGEHVGVMPYTQWEQAFDPLLTPGARNYWKSHNLTELRDGLLNTIIEYGEKLPTPHCEILIGVLAGLANRIPVGAMAYANRDAKFVLNVHGRWEKAADDHTCIGWARELFNATAPYESDGVYINFMTEEENGRVATAYGKNYVRLQQIKRQYDPENIFHMNQNIAP